VPARLALLSNRFGDAEKYLKAARELAAAKAAVVRWSR
jgi:hypothetical protein